MKTKQIFRTLCLVVVMCMVSANALAYDIHDGGIINVNPKYQSCKILVVEENATVETCNVQEGGVLIIKEGKTVTVTTTFNCYKSTIYVYGTLNIEQTVSHNISQSTVYIMQGGSLVGSYNDTGGNTISTNVAPAAAGSIEKVDAQVPTPANSFVGWPDYYQQRIYSTDGTDSYPLGDFEDAACTQPITGLDAWKTKYANIYHAGYDTGYAALQATLPTDPEGTAGTQVVITKDAKTLTLINPDKVKYSKVTE